MDQAALARELADDIFRDDDSLWFTGSALLRPKEWLALPQPRPTVCSVGHLVHPQVKMLVHYHINDVHHQISFENDF